MNNFIECQASENGSQVYPEEILKLALEMVCQVPSIYGLERFFQQWHSSTLIFVTGLEFRKLKNLLL